MPSLWKNRSNFVWVYRRETTRAKLISFSRVGNLRPPPPPPPPPQGEKQEQTLFKEPRRGSDMIFLKMVKTEKRLKTY